MAWQIKLVLVRGDVSAAFNAIVSSCGVIHWQRGFYMRIFQLHKFQRSSDWKNKTIFLFVKTCLLQTVLLLTLFVATNFSPCFGQTPPPIISVPSGTLSEPKQVAIAGVTGSTVYMTLDGVTTPSTSSPVYVAPIRVNYSLTIKAIAVIGGVASTVSSTSYTLDSVRWPAPDPSDASLLKINLHLPTTGIPK